MPLMSAIVRCPRLTDILNVTRFSEDEQTALGRKTAVFVFNSNLTLGSMRTFL